MAFCFCLPSRLAGRCIMKWWHTWHMATVTLSSKCAVTIASMPPFAHVHDDLKGNSWVFSFLMLPSGFFLAAETRSQSSALWILPIPTHLARAVAGPTLALCWFCCRASVGGLSQPQEIRSSVMTLACQPKCCHVQPCLCFPRVETRFLRNQGYLQLWLLATVVTRNSD